MDSASFQFIVFGLAAALVSNLHRSSLWRSIVLMVASAVFLGFVVHNPIVLWPLGAFLLIGYGALMLLERGWSRLQVWSIVLVVFLYIWLKKYTFLPEAIFLQTPYLTLGLSYIFFRVLHLLIEAESGPGKQRVGLGRYLLYTLNFTTFVSGPIQRYDEFARDQFGPGQPLGARVVGLQLERIVRGFFKVNVLAMLLDTVRLDAISQLSQPLPQSLKLYAGFRVALVYSLFLYCNFSGYIDIVIAIARLMRLELPENFDRPFSAASAIDFWNRWHITLSTWLKTYVYNPLLIALMRRIPSQAIEPYLGVFSFFVTFFLIGIWHGRTSEYIVFGLLQGSGVAINKLWQMFLTARLGRKGYKALAKNATYIAFARGLNFTWFSFTLFWFWGDWKMIGSIFGSLSAAQWLAIWLSGWLVSTAVLALWEWLRAALLSIRAGGEPVLTSRYARTVYASALALASFVVTVLLNQPAPGIVYKAF